MKPVLLSSPNNSLYYHVEDRRSHCTIGHDIANAIIKLIGFGAKCPSRVCCSKKLPDASVSVRTGRYVLKTLPWNSQNSTNSDSLCLMIPGLHVKPRQWTQYTTLLPKQFPKMHYLVGKVFKAGNCSLEEAGNPFVKVVENYAKKFPGKPIYLVGTSNGARIVSYIETKLNPKLLKGGRIKVFSIAGVHGGTRLIDLANRLCSNRLVNHHPSVQQDLAYGSETSQNLVRNLQERQRVWQQYGVQVDHYFYATTEDGKVHPVSSSLPYLESTPLKNYRVLSGETHETLVDRVQPHIFKIIRKDNPNYCKI